MIPFPTNTEDYPKYLFRDLLTGDSIVIPMFCSVLPDSTRMINLFVFNFNASAFSASNPPNYLLSIPLLAFNDTSYYCVGMTESIIGFVGELQNIKDRGFILNSFTDNA
jgi:hypothetical protein